MASRVDLKPGAAKALALELATKEVRACTRAINNKARRNAPGGPYSTGTLKQSIDWSVQVIGTDVRGISGSKLIYAYSVHEGQPARRIVPKRADYLVFFWRKAGKRVRLPAVNHPGTAPQPYLVQALLTEAPRFGFRATFTR